MRIPSPEWQDGKTGSNPVLPFKIGMVACCNGADILCPACHSDFLYDAMENRCYMCGYGKPAPRLKWWERIWLAFESLRIA